VEESLTWAQTLERVERAERRLLSYIERGKKAGRASVASRSRNREAFLAHMRSIAPLGGKARPKRDAEVQAEISSLAGRAYWAKLSPQQREERMQKLWAGRRAQARRCRGE
jgi:hypothetical protein